MSLRSSMVPILNWLGFAPASATPAVEAGRRFFPLKTINESFYLVSTSRLAPVWPAALRLLFRFAFVYFLLFIVTDTLPPPDDWVRWTALHFLHWNVVPSERNGSGDSAWAYATAFCEIAISVGVATVWSLLDWRRKQYVRLHELLRMAIRLFLFSVMMSYGSVKVYPDQFGTPSLHRLVQPYGQSSPMGLLWTFMAASPTYTFFGGAAEVLGGLLLVTRRTTLLGALVCAAVMLNVFMLNVSYDVPVKLYSGHLLALSIFLTLPDAGRLLSVFVFNRPAHAAPIYPVFRKRWLNNALMLLTVYLAWGGFASALEAAAAQHRNQTLYNPPLYGIWNVETTTIIDKGQVSGLSANDPWWQRIIFGNFGSAQVSIAHADAPVGFKIELDQTKRTLTLASRRPSGGAYRFSYQQDGDFLTLTGKVSGHLVTMRLRRVDETKMLLMSRKFHWINETPLNR